jgi:hypothetical protein
VVNDVMLDRLPFRHVVAIDFEFEFGGHDTLEAANRSGERPRPVCMVAKELRSGQTWRLWRGQFEKRPPFPLDNDTVLVPYYASAELGCFIALGWSPPRYMLDLFTEFRTRINGVQRGAKLINAAAYFGIDAISLTAKQDMISIILRGEPWTAAEQADILDYCESDVTLLERLLPAMLPRIDLPCALLRGRFMKAAAAIEWNGIPIDTTTLGLLRQHWTGIQEKLIAEIDRDYGVFEDRCFRRELWERWLVENHIPWSTTDTGQLKLDDDTFRQIARAHPAVAPMRELRSALSDMRLADLRCRQRWSKSYVAISIPIAHRPQPTEQYEIHFRPQRLAPVSNQAAGRLGRRLSRLEPTGVCYCGCAVWRRSDAGRVHVGRSLPRICQAGGPCATRRHQENPRRATRAVQVLRLGCGLWHGGQEFGTANRQARDRRPRSAACTPRNLS